MRRRQFLLASGALLAASPRSWSHNARPKRVVAVLTSEGAIHSDCTVTPPSATWTAFLDGLSSYGYKHGQSIVLQCRSAKGKHQQLDALAAELVRLQPTVIVAFSAPASLAAKRATSAIPIISVYTADPVQLGLVRSLARPGGNVTGLSALASDYVAKSLELLKDLAPQASRVGVIGQRANPTYEIYRAELNAAAPVLGLGLDFGDSDATSDIDVTLQHLRSRGANAFLVMHQPFTFERRADFVAAIARQRLPAVYGSREAVELGGLVSYAVSVPAVVRRSAYFVDKILRGVHPADLPVEQPINFELAINLRTAKALGIAVPQSILLRADRVIE